MSDARKDKAGGKKIVPPEVLRKQGNVINQTAQQIDPAGRHRVDVNASAQSCWNTKQPGNLPLGDDAPQDDPRAAQPSTRRSRPERDE